MDYPVQGTYGYVYSQLPPQQAAITFPMQHRSSGMQAIKEFDGWL